MKIKAYPQTFVRVECSTPQDAARAHRIAVMHGVQMCAHQVMCDNKVFNYYGDQGTVDTLRAHFSGLAGWSSPPVLSVEWF